MSIEGDDDHTVAAEQCQVADRRTVVGIDVQLKLRLEVKAVFVQEAGVHGVVTSHGFYQRRVQSKATVRL